jgi:hypothetical protein
VAYHSETLSDAVRKYPTYDKEMYSIVQCWALGPKFWKHLFEDAKIAPRSGPRQSGVSAQKSKAWGLDPRSADFLKENHFCNT